MSDFRERLEKAEAELTAMAQEKRGGSYEGVRLHGKAEGVRLALSYLREGYGVVKLPVLESGAILSDGNLEPEWQVWLGAKVPLVVVRAEPILHPSEARNMAAALLAAADAAEASGAER